MTTLLELCTSGRLVEINPVLMANELPFRRLFATPEFISWLDQELSNLPHEEMYADLSPLEQVSTLFAEYVGGENFHNDRRFKKLNRTPSFDVWEFKTDDVRIFGWVPERDNFICCYGDSKDQIEIYQRYSIYMAKTKYVMDHIDLDEPKAITGKNYSDVLSTEN